MQKATHVLIVEDDPLVGKMIEGVLEDIGYIVVGKAVDGFQAVEMTRALRPDVVLMDIGMPDMDGLEAAQLIQESCPTPVVVLTAYETPELVERASAAGVGAYLVKPSKANEMERAITIATARFKDMMELRRLTAELKATLTIARSLVSEVSLNNLLDFIMVQAEHLTNAEGAVVLLLNEEERRLEATTPRELWLAMGENAEFPVDQGSLAGLAMTSQQVQVSNHAQDDDRTASIRALLQPVELKSLLCAPLVAQGKSLGVLLIWNKRNQDFTANDCRLMGLFADQAALALYNAHLHTQNRQLAVEQERHRLARELHDSVTQSLYSIAMAAQTSLKLLDQSGTVSRFRDPIEHILALSRSALTEMREHLYDLHPTGLSERGLVGSLAQHCDVLRAQYSLTINFVAGPEPSLSIYQQQALYYIAKEALWNVIKHANATCVDVELTTDDDQVILSIVDNGVGFDPSIPGREAMGLRNMKERVRLLGGTFELQSRLGQGTQVTVQVPAQLPEQ